VLPAGAADRVCGTGRRRARLTACAVLDEDERAERALLAACAVLDEDESAEGALLGVVGAEPQGDRFPRVSGDEAFPRRYVNLDAARRRFGDQVDRLGRHLWTSDEPADRAIDAMAAMDAAGGKRGVGFRAFEQGLRGERLPAGTPAALRDLLDEALHVPAWVDWETCDRGGALLMRAGALGGAVLGTRSLVLGYASPGGNKPLVFSGRLTEQAARRLNETARFVQAVCRPGGMRPFADGWQITLKVRLIHAQVRKMILASGRWDAAAWGLPINQHDLAGTTLLFSASIIDGLRKLGMRIPGSEAESYIHLWRWAGRTIGVSPEVQPASEPEAMRLADLIGATMGEPDDDSRALTRALFEAALKGAKTPDAKREARRKILIGRLVCRELIGDELADKLDIPRPELPYVYAVPVVKRIVAGMERLTRVVPFGGRTAVAVGSRYWDRVVEIGLRGGTYEFPLPKSLVTISDARAT
jgi:hypothetical protein